MSERTHASEVFGLRSAFDPRSSDPARGPASRRHLASIYESRDVQLETATAFVRAGLERGERCLYLASENAVSTIFQTFREGGIDVDGALETGALSVRTLSKDGPGEGRFAPGFDVDEQLSFWEETVAEATDDEYAGVRVAVEMAWALGNDGRFDRLLEYESLLNTVFSNDFVVLCQYHRDRFPPSALADVIRTHPLFVHGGTVYRNVHYRPPAAFLEHDERDVDRLIDGLLGRARTRETLRERERGLSALTEVSRELLDASPAETCALVTETVQDVLEPAATGIWLHEGDGFERAATAGAPTVDREALLERCAPLARRAFDEAEPAVYDDLSERLSPIEVTPRSGCFHPLGDHGVLAAVSTREGAFDPVAIDFAETVATTTAAMLDRADRERALERRKRKFEQFASVVSHDLRNPLGVAQIYLQMAENRGDPADFEEARKALDRMETIIQNLLTMAQEGQTIAGLEPVALASVVESAWRSVETPGATLALGIAGERVHADEDALQTVLENLFRNAIEHGGDVTIRVEPLADGFAVVDDGPGLPIAGRDRLFEYGYSTEDGTGIGLSIVSEIVEAHGWSISAETAVNGGARFEITGVELLDGDGLGR